MATMKGNTSLSLLALTLAAAPAFAELPVPQERQELAGQRLVSERANLGLDARHTFSALRAHRDQLGQTHTRFQQTFQGVPVWGGEIITHEKADGGFRPHTLAHLKGIDLNTTATLPASEALSVAHQILNPKGGYAHTPAAELVIVPTATSYALAYHVHTELENGAAETKHTDFMIDAHTGAILKTWSTLHTTDAVGTGNSQFSGQVSIHTNYNGSSYELKDLFRAMNISTYNLNHGTSGTGTLYTDADNTWGDGTNYTGSTTSTTGATGQTAAVDAHYGIEMTYDYYKNVHGRNGIDNANRATYSRVHYSTSYDNAFWSDSCFCMTYGDGSSFKSLESMDVAGHEMTHGVTSNSAGLTYSGESGGLNEANSDIFGNMVEVYARNGKTIPATVANTDAMWTVGEQLATASFNRPLRYMYKPSLDGSSKDAWYSGLGSLDVHYSSGPMNRCFFFMSQGASSSSTSNYYSSYTPSGFTGIGPEKAAKIWYRTLVTYLTSTSNYSAARTGAISAVKDLYGAGGAEEAAVWNAFAAINVGSAWTGGGSTAPSASITSPSADQTVATGTAVSFTGSASGGTSPYTYSWNFGDGGTATGASASHTFTNTGSTAVTYTVTFTVTDAASKTGTATRRITVNPAGSTGSELVKNGGFESGSTSWTQTTGVIGSYTGEPAHAGSNDAWMDGYGSSHTDYVQQSITIPSTATGTLTFWLHIDTAETTTTTAYDTLKVQVISGTTTTTKATYSNLNKNTGYVQKSIDLSAYKGQTVTLKFLGVEDSSLQTSFVIDDVSVK